MTSPRLLHPAFSACLVAIAATGAAGCHNSGPTLVKAKVIALSPTEYAGKKLRLEGKVVEAGPLGSFFVLEDDTGRTFVSGASVEGRIECAKGQNLALVGEPKKYEEQVYFDAEKVLTCSR